jgi:hypothetical protein
VVRDALRSTASRDQRSADHYAGDLKRDGWAQKLRERATVATRVADALGDGAGLVLWPAGTTDP